MVSNSVFCLPACLPACLVACLPACSWLRGCLRRRRGLNHSEALARRPSPSTSAASTSASAWSWRRDHRLIRCRWLTVFGEQRRRSAARCSSSARTGGSPPPLKHQPTRAGRQVYRGGLCAGRPRLAGFPYLLRGKRHSLALATATAIILPEGTAGCTCNGRRTRRSRRKHAAAAAAAAESVDTRVVDGHWLLHIVHHNDNILATGTASYCYRPTT
jgi:hypothetical protein